MFTKRARLLWLLLILSELVLVSLSFEVAYLVRAATPEMAIFFLPPGLFIGLWVAGGFLWASTGLVLGVYSAPEVSVPLGVIGRALKQTFWFTVFIVLLIYFFKLGEISRLFLGLFIVLNFVVQASYRLLARRMRRYLQTGFTGHGYYLIVGTGPKAVEVAQSIERSIQRNSGHGIGPKQDQGDRIVGFVREPGAPDPDPGQLLGSYPLYELDQVPRMLEEHIVDEVLFAVSKANLESMEELFLTCEEQGVRTRVLVDFFPHFRSEITLDRLDHLPLLTFSTTPENEYLLFLKRAIDIALSSLLLVLGLPFLLAIALIVRLSSPGPVVYRQLRCGLNGRRFWLYKFRSMYENAEQDRQMLDHLNEMDGPVFKISGDPRATRVGRFLRSTSLDELPQLVNILQGDMSFVGPRPPLPEEVARYEKWQRRRLRMKPGLTCLWILEGRNELSFARWMKLDMEYIDHWSLALDFKIMLRTIPRVLTGRGAS